MLLEPSDNYPLSSPVWLLIQRLLLASDEAFKDFLRRSSDVISPGNSNLESLLIICSFSIAGSTTPSVLANSFVIRPPTRDLFAVANFLFLLRDAMPKRGISGRPVSVCLSRLCCIQTAKDIAKLLSRPDSLIILVFRLQAPVPNSKGNPFNRDVKYPGVRKLRFSTEIAVYLGNGTS